MATHCMIQTPIVSSVPNWSFCEHNGTMIGPDSSAYGTPQRGVSVNYFTGIDAVEEAEEIEDQTDLTTC